jgi:hypothetical protein
LNFFSPLGGRVMHFLLRACGCAQGVGAFALLRTKIARSPSGTGLSAGFGLDGKAPAA